MSSRDTIRVMDISDTPDWHVVIPVKGGPEAKTRLSVGRDDVRAAIARAIAEDSVSAALGALPAGRVLVATADPVVAAWATDAGAVVVPDPARGLNAAVRAAAERVVSCSVDRTPSVAILLGDVPALRPADLVCALDVCGGFDRAVVPDREGEGTVLLTARDAGGLSPRFGAGSARAHERLGHVRLELDLPHLRTDVDDATSLVLALELGLGPRTTAIVGEHAPDRVDG